MDDAVKRTAYDLCAKLRDAGYRALLAGGCVRDVILGKNPLDYDIATNATPDEVAGMFDHVIPVGKSFGVQLVVTPEAKYEVATFRVDGPYKDGRHPAYVEFSDEQHDAQRRDFTVNALFFDPANDQVIDYVGGEADIERKVIRAVGDPVKRFKEDYLRMLRAVRFTARLGYTLDTPTKDAIVQLAPNIQHTSAERIRDEITKMLTEGQAGTAFRLLDETGLLRRGAARNHRHERRRTTPRIPPRRRRVHPHHALPGPPPNRLPHPRHGPPPPRRRQTRDNHP
jgi:poly(A) polymerase